MGVRLKRVALSEAAAAQRLQGIMEKKLSS